MRLNRIQDDYRVFEQVNEEGFQGGAHTVYRITKKGITSEDAAKALAKHAGVHRKQVVFAAAKEKNGVAGQYMTVEGGKTLSMKDAELTIRSIGNMDRSIAAEDVTGNSLELILRDLEGSEMARLRHNLEQVKRQGMPNYFDDPRFGCLRHGQGFVVRHLIKGHFEAVLKSILAAPSPYGSEDVEKFKYGMRRRWGEWSDLAEYCRGRRGSSVFEHLVNDPEDFRGALERGISTRERNIHLFAYQSHLWNKVAEALLRSTAHHA